MSLAEAEIFNGLSQQGVNDIFSRSRHKRFAANEIICREGDPSESVLILEHGAAEVVVGTEERRIRRLRRGDVIGEVSLLTGEPRSATVRAVVATDMVEIHRDAIMTVVARHPQLLTNLSRILSRRLARAHVEQLPSGRGEAVGLVLGSSVSRRADDIIAAATAATPGSVVAVSLVDEVSRGEAVGSALAAAQRLDALLPSHRFVYVVSDTTTRDLPTLAAQLDRTIAVGSTDEVAAIVDKVRRATAVDAVVLGEEPDDGRTADPSSVRRRGSLDDNLAWIGRHVTRTKLGLALGAGGAKGYAHVGALAVLEEAGYTVDCVAGSSIGAIVGACIAMGQRSAEIEATLQKRFSPDVVKSVFALSFAGTSSGADTMRQLTEELVGDRTFDQLDIPFVAMTVDLTSRMPVPIDDGRVADALLAATALAGLFPPVERDGQRLVDGLALVPVPTGAASAAGADVTVAVNLMSRNTLPAWPGEEPPEPPGGRQRMLETLLEVMDLAQLDASVRNAEEASVVMTPVFGPSTWRDFHLADRFLAAGREAAQGALAHLGTLATPTNGGRPHG